MIEVYDLKYGNKRESVGFSIKQAKSGEVIDFITKYYVKKSRLSRDYVLTGISFSRRNMEDALAYFGGSRFEFLNALGRHCQDTAVLEDVFGSTVGCEVNITLPIEAVESQGILSFKRKRDNYTKKDVNVFVDNADYSHMFDGFDYYGEDTVLKTHQVIESAMNKTAINNGKLDLNDFSVNINDELQNLIDNFEFEA